MKSQNISGRRDCSGVESDSKLPDLSIMLVIAVEKSVEVKF